MLKHRKIYTEHHGPIPDGFHVHHKDMNHKNNDPLNLEALYPDDHAKKHGYLNNFIMAAAKASQRAIGVNKGKKHTQEFRDACRQRMVELWKDPAYRENAKIKIAESLRGIPKTKEHKINSGSGNKGKKRTAEWKQQRSLNMKKMWKNSVYRKHMSIVHKKVA